ncbi:hypothetical protein GQX74_001152 [Glossina fuscipes]|nr:hypothetical protein GQX74_001152 [Glossina fuscipes]
MFDCYDGFRNCTVINAVICISLPVVLINGFCLETKFNTCLDLPYRVSFISVLSYTTPSQIFGIRDNLFVEALPLMHCLLDLEPPLLMHYVQQQRSWNPLYEHCLQTRGNSPENLQEPCSQDHKREDLIDVCFELVLCFEI